LQVRHSQNLSQSPAKPWFICNKDARILSAHCDCTAGLGEKCSHVAALLFLAEFEASSADPLSVTEKECTWNRPLAFRELAMLPIDRIDFDTPVSKLKASRNASQPSFGESTVARRPIPAPTREENHSLFPELKKVSDKMIRPISVVLLSDYVEWTQHPSQTKYPTSMRHLFNEEHLRHSVEYLQDIAINLDLKVSDLQSDNLERDTLSQSRSKLFYVFRAGRRGSGGVH